MLESTTLSRCVRRRIYMYVSTCVHVRCTRTRTDTRWWRKRVMRDYVGGKRDVTESESEEGEEERDE